MTLDMNKNNAAELREVLRIAALKSAEVKAAQVAGASKESSIDDKAAKMADVEKESPPKQEKNDKESALVVQEEDTPPAKI